MPSEFWQILAGQLQAAEDELEAIEAEEPAARASTDELHAVSRRPAPDRLAAVTTKPPAFPKETDLCAAFIAAVPKDWLCYAETGGWDILLVRRNDGCQIGVEAKLRLNAEVLCQAAEAWYQPDQGPDYRAVLIPAGANNKLSGLASHCRLTILRQRSSEISYHQPDFSPGLPTRSITLMVPTVTGTRCYRYLGISCRIISPM